MNLLNRISLFICLFVLLFFVAPLFYILFQAIDAKSLSLASSYKDIMFVLIQSFLSASISIAVGLLIALSYLKKKPALLRTLYWGLLPQALPTILIVYTYFKVFSVFGFYPQSYVHVVAVHVFINMGLVAFLIFPHIQDQIEKKVHLMVSLQISTNRFFKMLIAGELAPTVFYIWILIFSFSMTSFSVPLLLSGSIPSSLEYLIYLKGYVEGDWASASTLSLIEFFFLGGLFLIKGQKLSLSSRSTNFIILNDKNSFLFSLNFLPLILIFFSLLHFGEASFLKSLVSLKNDLPEIFINTLFLTSWTLLYYSLLFWSQIYILNFRLVRVFHQFFWPLSPIILSFVILSFSLFFSDSMALKMSFSGLAIAVFIFPIVFKFWILPEYANLSYFFTKSEILDLSYPKVFSEVIVPYFRPAYKASLAYVGLFAIGDFTLSGVLISDLKTIGLSMRTYIQTYQLIEAQLMAVVLIICSVVLLYFFGGTKNENHKF